MLSNFINYLYHIVHVHIYSPARVLHIYCPPSSTELAPWRGYRRPTSSIYKKDIFFYYYYRNYHNYYYYYYYYRFSSLPLSTVAARTCYATARYDRVSTLIHPDTGFLYNTSTVRLETNDTRLLPNENVF